MPISVSEGSLDEFAPTHHYMSMTKPNIVLIMSDEHDPAVMGCYGDRLNPTPHLDALAARGVTFDNAYTNCPLCLPARLSFTSGKYVSRIGAWTNTCRLPSANYPTLATVLNATGYRSVLCGKMHFTDNHRYGFEELFPFYGNAKPSTGKGGRREADDDKVNRRQWATRAAEFKTIPDEEPFRNEPAREECDSYITARAIEFLQTNQTEPYFLVVGYHAPHFPLTVPQAWFDKFRGRIPAPVTGGELPLNYRQRNLIHGVTADIPAEDIQRGRECYWALTAWFDNEVGKVLRAIPDDTIVIYTSDHGENKGDHGMWWKSCMFEPSVRVPLIISGPAGQRRRGACSLVDLTQTIVDLAGAKAPADWDGASLRPWMENGHIAWRDLAVSEFYASGVSGYAMLRQGRYKYVYHTGCGEEELYDLERDPHELHNLKDSDRCAAMRAALAREVGRDPEEIEKQARRELAQGYET